MNKTDPGIVRDVSEQTNTEPGPTTATGAQTGSGPRRGYLILAVVLVVLVVAAGIYWFALRDDSSKDTASPGSNSSGLPDQKFEQSGVPFTFSYPGTFAQGKKATGFIWVAGVSPVDILDIRRVDDQEYSDKELVTVMNGKLSSQQGVKILGTGTNTYGGQSVVTFTVSSGSDPVLQSQLVYFSKAGSTWQLECQSQESNRAAIDAGCNQMLSTLSFS